MHRSLPFFLLLFLICLIPSTVQAATPPSSGAGLPWSALDPGDDWAAQILRDLFPLSADTTTSTIGSARTVIGRMLGQLTGYVMALAAAWVGYSVIIQIHRASETGRVLSESTSSWAPVRLGFAIIMMFPLPTGFSAGQGAVEQVSLWGIGMARNLYQYAIQAVGPDAMPIAQPMIPGTKQIVAGLIQNEICRAMINQAAGNPNLVPVPQPVTGGAAGLGGYVTWSYSLSVGNETGTPVCGTVTLRVPGQSQASVAGVSTDMAARQRAILTQIVEGDVRPQAESIAASFWDTRQSASLAPLEATYVNATNDYTQQLTNVATDVTSQIRAALQVNAARDGSQGLQQNQDQLAALGWTSAAAYYLEIARMNGQTLSLLSATPEVNPPSYAGLGEALSSDLAPLMHAILSFESKITTYAQTTDGTDVPGGNAELFSGATPDNDGAGALTKIARSLHITERLSNALTQVFSPTADHWVDPFAALIQLGQNMVLSALLIMGSASILASTTGSVAATAANVLTLNFSGALASVTGHMMMSFLATPVFYGCMALLVPGMLIAFVLPMIPYLMWIAGVAGWLILVCEAMVAVPLWMFAHLTFQGDGLHGRGYEGYSLLFNILFRPSLMLFGLFLGYFVFAATSWLIMQGFGIAASFVLSNGWMVSNFLGVVVLLCMFVLLHIVVALMSFRLISIVPHHVVKWVGFQPANRVDMEQFAEKAGMGGMGLSVRKIEDGVRGVMTQANQNSGSLARQRYIGYRPGNQASGRSGMDTTLRASTEIVPPASGEEGDPK